MGIDQPAATGTTGEMVLHSLIELRVETLGQVVIGQPFDVRATDPSRLDGLRVR